ncbi:Glutamyl/glutaminyl-tRNA synthetase, class Ib [Corchorus olitorius]|uniref:Glutamyl/glutaminyl-tRNA synthetase, class Ib n=1 Tax=Corchorus olitorius TaxID=93759 RepID=A0A1R3FWD1_9ROSI|nr:Glutamyl/glutaminyl-tRNA synthetase, class Ib [Corchorus olitorius]
MAKSVNGYISDKEKAGSRPSNELDLPGAEIGKLDMQDLNKMLRDPVYYCCNLVPHHRIESKYKLYPTYDFVCPFVDSKDGITHALRSSEYHDCDAQYYRIQGDLIWG